MSVSIIWKLSDDESYDSTTLQCLKEQISDKDLDVQVLIYSKENNRSAEYASALEQLKAKAEICEADNAIAAYIDAKKRVTGDIVTCIQGGDQWTGDTLTQVQKAADRYTKYNIFMLHKTMLDGEDVAFATDPLIKKIIAEDFENEYHCHPFYFAGTFLRNKIFTDNEFRPEFGMETEREFFLRVSAKEKKMIFLQSLTHESHEVREGEFTFFEGIYQREWYEDSFDKFWIPFLKDLHEKHGEVPRFIQYHFMFTIKSRIKSNINNRNKHVIPQGEETLCLERMGEAFQYIDDDILFDGHKIKESNMTDSMKWLCGILKYGKDFRFEKRYLSGNIYYGSKNTVFNKIANLKTNILFMNYESGVLSIDGTVHPILYSMADKVYMVFNGKKYPLNYNGRYSLTKVFGVSVYKGHSFHIDLPMDNIKECELFCQADVQGEAIKINFMYESHFSRMSRTFTNSYWCFGKEQRYMAVKCDEGMKIRTITKKDQKKQEHKLSKEMFLSFKKRAWIFLAVRKVYFMMRPIMKRKPIWMYLDKIYKGGDSSEYLYRYSCAQKDGIKHYYLIDKHATDYKRLKKDGYKPLVRGSIKHRLVFLMADMMVISNSTVFAFNNYGLPNSSYVRDLVDFHVCCVQHGMSVQKIAVAQNRLRDNTRLYFCASKYELENLSKPIYDYEGYDALKLTGVPRYDGLKNDDKKQIMISPTWRMQAAVPVRTSEGEQRDYNPLFKESTYFQVFNALINDPRLIEAAKKYGYRIKYVLHPIVSAQVNDFDKNDYVDIIPAVGDMSYETMFRESSLMVTDFSGIQFDFAYMRKPLVYLHHKDIPQHYEEGTFFYDTMAFGEIAHDNDELIDLLCEYMASGCKMKEEYVRRADDFFYYNDHNNCKRIYDTMIEYQEKKILPYRQK